jgi:hypothetical protein
MSCCNTSSTHHACKLATADGSPSMHNCPISMRVAESNNGYSPGVARKQGCLHTKVVTCKHERIWVESRPSYTTDDTSCIYQCPLECVLHRWRQTWERGRERRKADVNVCTARRAPSSYTCRGARPEHAGRLRPQNQSALALGLHSTSRGRATCKRTIESTRRLQLVPSLSSGSHPRWYGVEKHHGTGWERQASGLVMMCKFRSACAVSDHVRVRVSSHIG